MVFQILITSKSEPTAGTTYQQTQTSNNGKCINALSLTLYNTNQVLLRYNILSLQ